MTARLSPSIVAWLPLFGILTKSAYGHECRSVYGIPGYQLQNHILKTIKDVSFERCALLCSDANGGCYSINHYTTTNVCELNNKTRLWSADREFVKHDNCFYMDMLVRQYDTCVNEQPCKNNGSCISFPNNGTFRCDCGRHYAGKKCEELAPLPKVGNVSCSGKVLDLCQHHMAAWQAKILGPTSLSLTSCNTVDVQNTTELLLFVSRADVNDFGKYEIVRVAEIKGCVVTLLMPINNSFSGVPCELIAQRLPNFDHVTLTQSCQVTCRARSGAVGGILALRATNLFIDSSSKIDVTGKGYRGGVGGSSSGGGGMGGETFACLSASYGKGGNALQAGNAGGGAGEGSSGGPGGLNSGGGGGDSASNSDDGAGGGGGGGHFSGGGGGGAGTGCYESVGGTGGTASSVVNANAGGGGIAFCPGGNGGNGGSSGGNAGNNLRGGGGGASTDYHYGGGGGGGGFQFGNVDFNTRLSYGGGGGGGGGSGHGQEGGRGGNGGGLVLLLLDQLSLSGQIEANDEVGLCATVNINHRAAPGGSGAGGSVFIVTQQLLGSVSGKIGVEGGTARQCAYGTGGGGGGGIGRWVVKTPSSLLKSG